MKTRAALAPASWFHAVMRVMPSSLSQWGCSLSTVGGITVARPPDLKLRRDLKLRGKYPQDRAIHDNGCCDATDSDNGFLKLTFPRNRCALLGTLTRTRQGALDDDIAAVNGSSWINGFANDF